MGVFKETGLEQTELEMGKVIRSASSLIAKNNIQSEDLALHYEKSIAARSQIADKLDLNWIHKQVRQEQGIHRQCLNVAE